MSMTKRYNYRAYPTQGQCGALACLFGACRHAYNWAIEQRELMRRRHGRMQTYNQLSAMFTQHRHDPGHAWLTSVSSTPLQQAIRHADKAYQNFFRQYKAGRTRIVTNQRTGRKRRTGLPRFKSRRDGEQAAEFTKSARFKIEHTHGCKWAFLTLPKVGTVKLRWTRDLPTQPSSVTIMRHADGTYEASFVVQAEQATAPAPIHEACGIDMGLESLMSVVHADGTRQKIPHPRTLSRKARRLRKLDKQLARQRKGTSNHAKTLLLRARAYKHIQNQRKDMAYKLAFMVAGENQAVALETLNVNALARTRMAKSLLDANWARIITRITELCAQYERTLVRIDRWYPSSQICSYCGRRDGRKPLNVRTWQCPACSTTLDRDYNAAVNILDAAGLAESLNARGDEVRRALASADEAHLSTKREPTEPLTSI